MFHTSIESKMEGKKNGMAGTSRKGNQKAIETQPLPNDLN